jgi:hypothetical protein
MKSLPTTFEINVKPTTIPSKLLVTTFEVKARNFIITELTRRVIRGFGLPLWGK